MSAPVIPQAPSVAQLEEIVGKLELIEDERVVPKKGRVRVLVSLPHLAEYGHETTRELVYGCTFPVRIGDAVICPPTPLFPSEFTGVVVSMDASGYSGPIKYLVRRADS